MVDEDIRGLTQAMVKNDESAYRKFFAFYFARLHAYSRKLTQGKQSLAEDVTQEALLRVARSIKVFHSEESFWCWLILLARCAFIDIVRKEVRYKRLLDQFEIECEFWQSPSGNSIGSSEALHSALKRLSSNERRLLRAKYHDEASYREIAGAMELSEKAVESRLSRLRSKLRRLLERKTKDERL